MPQQFGEPPGVNPNLKSASIGILETPRIVDLPDKVRPVENIELPKQMLPEQGRRHSDIIINQMRDYLITQKDNPIMEGTIIQELPDEALNNDDFLNLVVSEHRQMVSNQLIIADKLGTEIDPQKLRIMTLPDAVRRSLSDIDKDSKYTELSKKMLTDELTGARNRAYYSGPLRDRVEQAIAAGEDVAEVALDVDFFKKINDNYTHEVGDEVLKKGTLILDSIHKMFRTDSFFVCRIGGDEFRLVFIGAPQDRVISGLETIRNMTEVHLTDSPIEGRSNTTFSMGVSFSNQRKDVDHQLLANEADFAAYDAKTQGKDTYWVYRQNLEEHTDVPDELKARMKKARENALERFSKSSK